ncbi:MAG: UDP-N-acetylmuramoyl-L-alanine--D-glutamate ligase [Fusicatenibacter sp.]|nr:UDP-N-acetylmuramoyl-L-alanine--D-glutamate ligase [Fusicatenibacter sp.]
MELAGKKVLVFGTGKSGIGAADLLRKTGADVILYDGNGNQNSDEILGRLENPNGVRIVLGNFPEKLMSDLDLAVLSPGVPTDLPEVLAMKAQGIRIWGEVELAYETGKGTVLAITGTNGKTTTTSLLGEIMKAFRADVKVVGNIGTPYTSVALEETDDTVTVAEISSFQLETIEKFHPMASAITNITEDHLNRHHTMEEYIRVKELITKNQTMEDLCVLNYEDEILRPFGEQLKAEQKVQVMYFSSLRALEEGMYYQDGGIYLADENGTLLVTKTEDLKLLGLHNFENVMVAVAMALHAGVPMDTVRKVIRSFAGVEHRIEYVCEKDGIVYYNDSKGTNPDAAIKGIQAMNRPTLLIGGGYDKQSTYEEWIRAFDGKVRYLVLIGATKEKIAEAAREVGFTDILFAGDLKEAVQICHQKANPGDAVLLSPACASWDQFKSYEQRGELFKEYVRAL